MLLLFYIRLPTLDIHRVVCTLRPRIGIVVRWLSLFFHLRVQTCVARSVLLKWETTIVL